MVHAAGLVHRDLKPPNVMLREDGSVVLIDFGLAKRRRLGGRNTTAGVLRGSPYYMSPEQAQGLPLDARSDLYSLGVMLFEMLSGGKPYSAAVPWRSCSSTCTGRGRRCRPSVSSLEPLIDRMMARDREPALRRCRRRRTLRCSSAIDHRSAPAPPRLEAVVGLQ